MDKCECNGPRCLFTEFILLTRKEVAFHKGKVLLSRLGDNIYATSAYCTHYGAPLAKAVLTSDGRVVWYGPPFSSSHSIPFISLSHT